jgi:tRNA (guanine-N7-)-methyltransferase
MGCGARSIHVIKPHEIDSLLSGQQGLSNVEIEIGCGNGHFLVEYGERQPDALLIGVELKKRRCEKSIRKIKDRGLDNIHIVWGRAEEVLQRLPNESIDAFHIYFPDPWPKSRHRRRRLFRMPYLRALCQKLKTGGAINFATDFFDYYLQAKVLILLHPRLQLADAPPTPELNLSLFNQRFTCAGKEIFFTSAIKNRL